MQPLTAPPLLDLNQLRMFAFVANLRSFSEAAAKLATSKSTISRSLVQLEEQLGGTLLVRTTRKVRLTPRGEVVLKQCNEMLGMVNDTVGYVESLDRAPAGPLNLCVSPGVGLGQPMLSTWIPAFLADFPEVRLDIRSSADHSILLSRGIDISIFCGDPAIPGVQFQKSTVRRVFCAAPAYLDAQTDSTSLEVLQRNWISGPGTSHPADLLAPRERVDLLRRFDARLTVADEAVLREFLLAGVGVGCLPVHKIQDDLDAGRLAIFRPDLTPQPLNIGVAFPSQRTRSPAVVAFSKLLSRAGFLSEELTLLPGPQTTSDATDEEGLSATGAEANSAYDGAEE